MSQPSGRLVILCGPSCVGKSPLVKALGKFHPEWFERLQGLVLYNSRSPTGMPGLTTPPFSENADGSFNVFAASLFGFRGKFYTYFATFTVNFANGTLTPVIPGEIYQIDPATGHATPVAPLETVSTMVTVNDMVYGFNATTGEVLLIDPTTGQTSPVSSLDPALAVIAGATPARPAPTSAH